MYNDALKIKSKNSKLYELNRMIKKEQKCELSKCKAKPKKKESGEFFEFRFHEIILGLDFTALSAWLVRQARIFGSFFS